MALDFDALVTAPAMNLFACTVRHARAAGGFSAARGVFDRVHLEIGFTDAGAPMTAVRTTLGVRLADFASVPIPTDRVQVALRGSTQVDIGTAGATAEQFTVADVQRDGAGGALLILTGRAAA